MQRPSVALALAGALLSLPACSSEAPLDAAAVQDELASLAGVEEVDADCYKKAMSLWGDQECDVVVTMDDAATEADLEAALEQVRRLAGEDIELGLNVGTSGVRVTGDTDPRLASRYLVAARSFPQITMLASSFEELDVALNVAAPLPRAVEVGQELLGDGTWQLHLRPDDDRFGHLKALVLDDGDDVTDEIAVAEAVVARYGVDELELADGSVSITLKRAADDGPAVALARSLPQYDDIASVRIAAVSADASLERRVEVAIESTFPEVGVDKGGFLIVDVGTVAKLAEVDAFLEGEFGKELAKLQFTYRWGPERSLHRPVQPKGPFDIALLERLEKQREWEEIRVSPRSELRSTKPGYSLHGSRSLTPEQAGRLLAQARVDDQDLPIQVYGGSSATWFGIDVTFVGGKMTLDPAGTGDAAGEAQTRAAFQAGWDAGVAARD